MFNSWETVWTFQTARVTVTLAFAPDYDLDLSWDEDGEARANLESGLWQAFQSRVTVTIDGVERGEDYLGGSIYERPMDFIDHRGMNSAGHGSYFSDMVRGAIAEARRAMRSAPAPLALRV